MHRQFRETQDAISLPEKRKPYEDKMRMQDDGDFSCTRGMDLLLTR
jgi:hypothetical protein